MSLNPGASRKGPDENFVLADLLAGSGLVSAEEMIAMQSWWALARRDALESFAEFLSSRGVLPSSVPRTVACICKGYLKPDDPAALLSPVDVTKIPAPGEYGASAPEEPVDHVDEAAEENPAAPLPHAQAETARPSRRVRRAGAVDALRSMNSRLGSRNQNRRSEDEQ